MELLSRELDIEPEGQGGHDWPVASVQAMGLNDITEGKSVNRKEFLKVGSWTLTEVFLEKEESFSKGD